METPLDPTSLLYLLLAAFFIGGSLGFFFGGALMSLFPNKPTRTRDVQVVFFNADEDEQTLKERAEEISNAFMNNNDTQKFTNAHIITSGIGGSFNNYGKDQTATGAEIRAEVVSGAFSNNMKEGTQNSKKAKIIRPRDTHDMFNNFGDGNQNFSNSEIQAHRLAPQTNVDSMFNNRGLGEQDWQHITYSGKDNPVGESSKKANPVGESSEKADPVGESSGKANSEQSPLNISQESHLDIAHFESSGKANPESESSGKPNPEDDQARKRIDKYKLASGVFILNSFIKNYKQFKND